MNRKEASNHIGKPIRVIDPLLGSYIGELVDIIAEPRKPWRGIVKINAIEQYPVQNLSDIKNEVITRPPFTSGETYEITGSKIEPVNVDDLELNFEASLRTALLNEISHFNMEKEKVSHVLNELQNELQKIDPSYTIQSSREADYQYYTIFKNSKDIYLNDQNNNLIPLSNCPFEFEINVNGHWHTVQYDDELSFVDDQTTNYEVAEGDQIRINKQQFDPYHIFINELEKPALDSLTNGLKKYEMSHEHCVNCHNTLLNQYLATNDDKYFKGVNFISYQNKNETLIVQHHYEREICTDGQDVTYDRFEFTNDKGRRLLMTYTTESS